jgi:single-strand DNA-binding protein
MAVNRRAKGQDGEMRETTCFVDMTAFGKQAEVLEKYVKKGSQLFIEGRLEYSTWEDKNGGGKRSKLEVIVENFQFLGGGRSAEGGGGGGVRRSARGGQQQQQAQEGSAGAGGDDDYGDIPF